MARNGMSNKELVVMGLVLIVVGMLGMSTIKEATKVAYIIGAPLVLLLGIGMTAVGVKRIIFKKRALPDLIMALDSRDEGVRRRAVLQLGEIKDRRAVERLIDVLGDAERGTRSWAVEALGKIGDPRAVGPLISILKDQDWMVRMRAAEALGKITGENLGEDQGKWEKWWEENKAKFQSGK